MGGSSHAVGSMTLADEFLSKYEHVRPFPNPKRWSHPEGRVELGILYVYEAMPGGEYEIAFTDGSELKCPPEPPPHIQRRR